MRPHGRLALVVVTLVLVPALAGCIGGGALRPSGTDVLDLAPRAWLDNWSVEEMDFVLDYDPDARHASAQGWMRLKNELGEERPYVLLFMEALDVTRLTDANGQDLYFTVHRGTSLLPEGVPEEARVTGLSQVVNVTLSGATNHGAKQVLHLAYEGWGGGRDTTVAGGVPNEVGQYLHFGLVPIVAAAPSTMTRLTLSHPDDWVVLASLMREGETREGGRVTTTYAHPVNFVAVTAAQGLEWLEDEVDGIDVRTYFYPDMRVQGRTTHDITLRVLRVMPAYTGPYPFDHLWTVPNQVVANAFSTAGLTFMGLNFYRFTVPDAPYQFGRFTPYPAGQDGFEMVVVHEHVHNWWGHNVRGNNSNLDLGPRDTWVSEGITTYLSELVWFDTQYGAEDARASAHGKVMDQLVRKRFVGEERAITEAGGDFYEKTALALRALEAYALATERPDAVFDALKLAQERHGRVNGGTGVATSREMIAVFEEVFEEDLSWHFEPWFFGRELADFRVGSVAAKDGDVLVTVQNVGTVQAAVLVKATTATGRELYAWGVAPASGSVDVLVDKPSMAARDPVVRVELDPFQHVYEWNEADNVWAGVV